MATITPGLNKALGSRRALFASHTKRDFAIPVAAFVAYLTAFGVLHNVLGNAIGALVVAPITAASWMLGMRAGIACSVVSVTATVLWLIVTSEITLLGWLFDQGGLFVYVAGTIVAIGVAHYRDVSIQRSALALELRGLTWQMARNDEEVRRSVSFDLHDELGQKLTGLKFLVEAGDQKSLSAARDVIGELLKEMRELSYSLRPPTLEPLGLNAAVREMIQQFSTATEIDVTMKSTQSFRLAERETELAAYRIVQEALTNVARHSGARHAEVNIASASGELKVVVVDDGRGMLDKGSGAPSTIGITSMRERALAVGGRLEIESSPDKGTRVIATLPL